MARATRGHRFGGVLTTPRGKDLFLLCYSLAKSHVNGWGYSKAWISRVFGLKTFEPSGENPHFCGREQCQPKGFTVHMNSDVIFGVNFYDVE